MAWEAAAALVGLTLPAAAIALLLPRRLAWSEGALLAAYGASAALLLAVLAAFAVPATGLLASSVVLALLAFPAIEEAAKAAGLPLARAGVRDAASGAAAGAAAGAGFGLAESLFHAAALAVAGLAAPVETLAARAGTPLLHLAASALAGAGYGAAHGGRSRSVFAVALLGAIALHAAFNLVALEAPEAAPFVGAAAGVAAVLLVLRRRASA